MKHTITFTIDANDDVLHDDVDVIIGDIFNIMDEIHDGGLDDEFIGTNVWDNVTIQTNHTIACWQCRHDVVMEHTLHCQCDVCESIHDEWFGSM